MLLQIALFCAFFMANILLYICTTSSLSSHLLISSYILGTICYAAIDNHYTGGKKKQQQKKTATQS